MGSLYANSFRAACFISLLHAFAFGQQANTAISLSETKLSFSAPADGDAPSPQFIGATSTGQSLPFSLRVDGGAWILARPAKGSTPARIQVSVDQTGLA